MWWGEDGYVPLFLLYVRFYNLSIPVVSVSLIYNDHSLGVLSHLLASVCSLKSDFH